MLYSKLTAIRALLTVLWFQALVQLPQRAEWNAIVSFKSKEGILHADDVISSPNLCKH